ncbi:DUF3386 domain-containing protein [Leptolyngbya sp. AN03gr2]|uniref:DUF3386 domain-containing protein n=1 Tax=unclassified Leptolyngbya TaxID=2650499 RepID=UPI003D31670A
MTTTVQTDARALFRAAYENRYTWDEKFPGYTADVTYREDGKTYTAKCRINADFTFDVSDIEDGEGKKAIHGQVWEIAVHRVRRAFEATHGENIFSLGETDPDGGVEIFVEGKSKGDRYKVRNNEVSLVHRHIHGVVVTINTFSSHDTGNGYLSHRYDSLYSDPKTGAVKGSRSEFEDLYEEIGGYYILTSRTITTGEHKSEFLFSNIQLLEGV